MFCVVPNSRDYPRDRLFVFGNQFHKSDWRLTQTIPTGSHRGFFFFSPLNSLSGRLLRPRFLLPDSDRFSTSLPIRRTGEAGPPPLLGPWTLGIPKQGRDRILGTATCCSEWLQCGIPCGCKLGHTLWPTSPIAGFDDGSGCIRKSKHPLGRVTASRSVQLRAGQPHASIFDPPPLLDDLDEGQWVSAPRRGKLHFRQATSRIQQTRANVVHCCDGLDGLVPAPSLQSYGRILESGPSATRTPFGRQTHGGLDRTD